MSQPLEAPCRRRAAYQWHEKQAELKADLLRRSRTDLIPTAKNTCEFCGRSFPRGTAMHRKFCKSNPINGNKRID